MSRHYDQKLSLLYILDYLERESDEAHPVNAATLIDMLARHDIICERKTIYSDINLLQLYLDPENSGIEKIKSTRGKNGGYYIDDSDSRAFKLAELKLLIDAVQSSRYLTPTKSKELISKLCTLCNRYEAGQVKRDLVIERRVKSMNESIYNSVDAIQEAITQNRQIKFRYFDWDITGKRKYRDDKDYIASPYGLSQNNENCYLLAYSQRHGTTSYRVDRMTDIQIIDKKRDPCPELSGQNLVAYANKMFQMYSGETQTIRMRFHRSLVNVVVDRFGRDVIMIPDGPDHFIFMTPVAVSPLFLSWIVGFGDKAKILSPQSVADQCVELCKKVIAQYNEG